MKPYEEKRAKLKNGEKIYFRVRKGGEHPLVLIHGNMVSSENLDVLMSALSDDFTVYAVDLRGFGRSSYEQPIESIRDFSEDLRLLTRALKLKRFSIMGWSLGGNVAMRYALDYPDDVHRLILLAPGSAKGFPMRKKRLGIFPTKQFLKSKQEVESAVRKVARIQKKNRRKLAKWILKKGLYTHRTPNDARMTKYIDAFLSQRNLADVNYALTTFNLTDQYNGVVEGTNEIHKLNKPVLILHGEDDKVVPPVVSSDNRAFIGENAQVETFKDAGHALHFDHDETIAKRHHTFLLDKKE